MTPLEYAQTLITIPSLTPEDKGCLTFIGEKLKTLGFSLEFFPAPPALNLWARRGTEGPLVCFAGHTDVVPTGEESAWQSPPFVPTVRGDRLYGRGVADMKGAIAAFLTALERFLAQKPHHTGSIGLLLTSAEESCSELGTLIVVKALEARGEKITYCVVGEPSSEHTLGDIIKNGRRGSLNGQLTIYGKQGHIAYPHLADNPIHTALRVLSQLQQMAWDQGNEYFPPTSFQFSNIFSGTGATNVIPGTLKCQFNFRFTPEVTASFLQERVVSLLTQEKIHYDLTWDLSGEPFLTPEGTLTKVCQQAVQAILGISPILSTGGGTSDARFIAPTGAQVLELGLCNDSIHQVNENILLADLDKLSLIYEQVLAHLL